MNAVTDQSAHSREKQMATTRASGRPMPTVRKLAVAGPLTAAAGIVVQILGGADYPAVPPGVLLLAAAAGLLAIRNKWTSLLGVAVPLFITFGAFATPNTGDHLSHPSAIGVFAGTLIQLLGLAAGVVCGLVVAVQSLRKGQPV